VRASFLPGRRTVMDRLPDVAMHQLDLTKGAVLERAASISPSSRNGWQPAAGVSARANPKSSTGRVDVFVRLLTDHGAAFDDVAEGYDRPAVSSRSRPRPSRSWSAPAPG
jgi:dCTP deaminase